MYEKVWVYRRKHIHVDGACDYYAPAPAKHNLSGRSVAQRSLGHLSSKTKIPRLKVAPAKDFFCYLFSSKM